MRRPPFRLALPALLAATCIAGAAEQRPSASLVRAQPAWLQDGECVVYRESRPGSVAVTPEYFVRGAVVAARVEERRLAVCPAVPGKAPEHYSRAEFNRLARAAPCVSAERFSRHVELGVVRLRVGQWETPHERRAASAGRLYRGMFIDQPLAEGVEIEIETDLLARCAD